MLRGRQRCPPGRRWDVGGERGGGFALARRLSATAATTGGFSAASTPHEPCALRRTRASRGERGTGPPPVMAAHPGAAADITAAHPGTATDLYVAHLGATADLYAAHLGAAADLYVAHLGAATDLMAAARLGAAPEAASTPHCVQRRLDGSLFASSQPGGLRLKVVGGGSGVCARADVIAPAQPGAASDVAGWTAGSSPSAAPRVASPGRRGVQGVGCPANAEATAATGSRAQSRGALRRILQRRL